MRKLRTKVCPQCDGTFETRRTQECCSRSCARRLQALREQRDPDVCICDEPSLTGDCQCGRSHVVGECRGCHRIYRPDVPGFDAVRDAWRTQLAQEAVA